MSYRVGQVVYVVMAREMRVVPLQIVKEVTEKTLDGDTVEYIVRGRDESSTMAISAVEGEVFETADKARKALVERATVSVHRLVDKAVENAKLWFAQVSSDGELPKAKLQKAAKKQPIENVQPVLQDEVDESHDFVSQHNASPGSQLVKMADGTFARVKLDPSLVG